MNVLFVHNNFPAQFRNLAESLAQDAAHRVVAIGAQDCRGLEGVEVERYRFTPAVDAATHPFARRFDLDCRRAEQVLYTASRLRAAGLRPDLCLVHCGWGENLPLRAVFPASRIVTFCEFYYRAEGQDVDFDPEIPAIGLDGIVALQAKNAATLLSLVDSDLGVSPTAWQRATYPAEFLPKIRVAHEGIDPERVHPDPDATLALPSGRVLTRADEVMTFVARGLEPMRGFRSLMRALPAIQRARPDAQCVIIGDDAVAYGAEPDLGGTWKAVMLAELAGRLDLGRIHFLGRVPYPTFLATLQVSTAHVYLTYPFVLSWSLLEAMAAGCRLVCSDTEPVREVLDQQGAVLVPFFDTARLSAEVARILANPAGADARAAHARTVARDRFDRRDCVRRLRRILDLGA